MEFKKIALILLIGFCIFSIAQAGQITYSTNQETQIQENGNEVLMNNIVIGIKAYQNVGLENAKTTYFTPDFLIERGIEEIVVEKYDTNSNKWKKVSFSNYNVNTNYNENTITKTYSKFLGDSFSIEYHLETSSSPVKISFNLFSLSGGTYRIIWKIAELNMDKEWDLEYKKYFAEENKSEEEFDFMINYGDLIEAVGEEKVNYTRELSQNGKINSTVFTLGEFDLGILNTIHLDPQITTGHTVNQFVQSIWKQEIETIYQETANATNCTNEECDGNWSSYNSTSFYANYTQPSWAYNPTWQFKSGDISSPSTYNATIPNQCIFSNTQLYMEVSQTGTFPYDCSTTLHCWNGTDWYCFWNCAKALKISCPNYGFYEEAIWWIPEDIYWVSATGDYESGSDDGGYALNNTNYTDTSWTLSVEFPNGAGDQNFMIEDNNTALHFLWHDSYDTEEKNSTDDGVTWSSARALGTVYGYFGDAQRHPLWQEMGNGEDFWASRSSGDVWRIVTYDSSSDTFAFISTGFSGSRYLTGSVFQDSDNDVAYFLLGDTTDDKVEVRYSTNYWSGSGGDSLSTTANPSNPQIWEFDNDLYLIYSDSTDGYSYFVCNQTERASGCTSAEWGSSQIIPQSPSSLDEGVEGIESQGIFAFQYSLTTMPYWVLAELNGTNDKEWFKLNDTGFTANASFNRLRTLYDSANDVILLAWSDDVSGTYEVFTDEYEVPDVLVKFIDEETQNTITTELETNVYCNTTLMKSENTTTGAIAIYPSDYSGCTTNSTTVQAIDGYYEKNTTLTRTENLTGYLTEMEYINTTPKYFNITENPADPTEEKQATYSFGIDWKDWVYEIDTVVFNWNGTDYTPTCTPSLAVNETTCEYNLTYLSYGNYTYYWWANNTYGLTNQTSNITYQVNEIDLATGGTTLCFDFYNEITEASETMDTVEAIFTILFDDGTTETQSFKTTSVSTQCYEVLNATDVTVNLQLQYDKSGYATREYFLYHYLMNNSDPQTLDLYTIDSTNSSGVVITVKDIYEREQPDTYIKVQRFYPSSNSYQIVAMGLTDENGQTRIYLQPNDIYYRFVLEQAGQTILTTDPMLVIADTLTFKYSPYEIIDMFAFQDIETSVTFNNATKTWQIYVNDVTGEFHELCYEIIKTTNLGSSTLCEQCVNSSSVTFTCQDASFDLDANYYVSVWGVGSSQLFYSEEKSGGVWSGLADTGIMGESGNILSVLLIFGVASVGFFYPIVAIVLALVSLFVTVGMELIVLTTPSLIALGVAGALLIWRLFK